MKRIWHLNLLINVAICASLAHGCTTAQKPAEGPCDIYQSYGMECVAAHSTTRILYSEYDGPLYQVVRESDGKTLDISVAPCEKGRVEGEQKAYERWGLTAKEINQFADPDLAFFAPEGGLYVAATSWEGNASVCGLRRRDVIVSVDGTRVKTLADLDKIYEAALRDLPGRYKMRIDVSRKGRDMQFVLNYLEDTEKEDVE